MPEHEGWVRSQVVGVMVGLLAGGLIILLIEAGAHRLFGTAAPGDLSAVTTSMFAAVLVAWIVGAAAGAAVAMYWSRSRSARPGVIVGLVLLAGAIANMFAFPHPVWMIVAAIVLVPLAATLTARRMAPSGTAA